MFANVRRERERKRERERERLVQARQSEHCIGGSTSREVRACVLRACVCVCVCVCVLFECRHFVCFFYSWDSSTLGTRLRISKFCVDLCKKI